MKITLATPSVVLFAFLKDTLSNKHIYHEKNKNKKMYSFHLNTITLYIYSGGAEDSSGPTSPMRSMDLKRLSSISMTYPDSRELVKGQSMSSSATGCII